MEHFGSMDMECLPQYNLHVVITELMYHIIRVLSTRGQLGNVAVAEYIQPKSITRMFIQHSFRITYLFVKGYH